MSKNSWQPNNLNLFPIELSLLGISMAVASVSNNFLERGSRVLSFLLLVFLAHVFLIMLRRTKLFLSTTYSISFIFLLLMQTLLLFPDFSYYGLPTYGSLRNLTLAASDGFTLIINQEAPLNGDIELYAFLSFIIFAVIIIADFMALGLKKVGETIAVYVLLFSAFLYLGFKKESYVYATAMVAMVAIFILLHRRTAHKSAFREPAKLPRFHITAGSLLVFMAIGIGVLATSVIPSTRSEALISINELFGAKITQLQKWRFVNPLVEIGNQLNRTGNTPLFEVTSKKPTYWRTTSLNTFDGSTWSAGAFNGSFWDSTVVYNTVNSTEDNISKEREGLSTKAKHSFELLNLGGPWLPHAYLPISSTIRGDGFEILYNSDLASVVAPNRVMEEDKTYSMSSSHLNYDAVALNRFSRTQKYPRDILRFTDLPDNFPTQITDTALKITASGESDFEKALLLQNWFHENFKYSESFPQGHGTNAILEFLDAKQGFCEQFSGTFAAMARSLGIPARVAVGFTSGKYKSADSNTLVVSSKDAHAWPEIYVPKIGWVEMEPTPTRGSTSGPIAFQNNQIPIVGRLAPGTLSPEESLEGSVESENSTIDLRTDTANEDTTDATRPDATPDPNLTETGTAPLRNSEEPPTSGLNLYLLRAILITLLVMTGYFVGHYFARKKIFSYPDALDSLNTRQFIFFAWVCLAQKLSQFGLKKMSGETRTDFLKRANNAIGIVSLEALAIPVNEVEYAPYLPSIETAQETMSNLADINKELNHQLSTMQKVLSWINPLPTLKLFRTKVRIKNLY